MKTKYLFLAALSAIALTSCTSEDFVGLTTDNSPTTETDGAIKFGFEMTNATRADIYGGSAAELLGNNFYVTGTKGTEPANSPTTNLVFDNYLVRYEANTAGNTTSNTANWEYVGVGADSRHIKLSPNAQTIKYWDYSTAQYDFLAFSTGKFKAVEGYNTSTSTYVGANTLNTGETPNTIADGEIGVTKMLYGTSIAIPATYPTDPVPVAYSFILPSVTALENAYISDITKVEKGSYGKEVTLRFKNLGSKVRVALYETVPGYSVKAGSVRFYTVDGTTGFTTDDKGTDAALISANTNGLPTNGQIDVYFPHVGSTNIGAEDYNKAAATVNSPSTGATYDKHPIFGALDNKATAEGSEEAGSLYLGRTFPSATFAGSPAASYYKTVFPVSSPDALTLRVDYTLVSTDGSTEEIQVLGAKAVVPSKFTTWLPNYAYTYVFKISDNTNGWTSPDASTDGTDPGLFPITFDAVVAEATDATAEQKTITTVAAPSITTYQQKHDKNDNEYAKATGKNIYVQVMDNRSNPATLVSTLNENVSAGLTPEGGAKSLLYQVDVTHAATATEAQVMDALQKRTAAYDKDATTITGRNDIELTKRTITNNVTSIVNGPDNNPITVTAGEAAMIQITGTGALNAGTYAYVYDYTTVTSPATKRAEIEEYQPIVPGETHVESSSSTKTFYTITTAQLELIAAETSAVDLTAAGANDYLYFSKTTNGTGTTTYSYISVVGKKTLPVGVVKIAKSEAGTTSGTTTPVPANTFFFDKYFSNDGAYAVKVIKIV